VHLRRLGGKDLPLVEEHLLGLDMPSRNSRFHCGFGDAAVAAYVRDLDPNRDVLFGAIDPGTGRIVGLAEARPANGPKTVDLATSVLPSHRKRGLAHVLVTRAAGVASDQGATAADLRFSPGNLAANHIAARLGASFRAPGIAVVRLPLCEPLAEGVARQMEERGSSSGMTAKGPDAAAACVPLAFWTTPTMTAGHLLFAIGTTDYIVLGVYFEERDLIALFGDQYRRYRKQVSMLIRCLAEFNDVSAQTPRIEVRGQ
jgi:GNAT superfamily N-acetyltransferase